MAAVVSRIGEIGRPRTTLKGTTIERLQVRPLIDATLKTIILQLKI